MWDLFISYASEDRPVAQSLASAIQSHGIQVWFDAFSLRVGDNLRSAIDHGLSLSRFGAVILSHSFFGKNWPLNELDGMLSRERSDRRTILPVWHELTADEVRAYSPILAGRVAVSTTAGIPYVAQRLIQPINLAGDESKPWPDQTLWPKIEVKFLLRVETGPDTGKVFGLIRERCTVGRSTAADIRLRETSLSRSHFAVSWDANSKFHTVDSFGHPDPVFLNKTPLGRGESRRLNEGDLLAIGDTTLRYERITKSSDA